MVNLLITIISQRKDAQTVRFRLKLTVGITALQRTEMKLSSHQFQHPLFFMFVTQTLYGHIMRLF